MAAARRLPAGGRPLAALLLGAVFVLTGGRGEAAEAQSPEALTAAELRLQEAVTRGREGALRELYEDPSAPGPVRGRAFWALHRGRKASPTASERAELLGALRSPVPEVRRAALRAIGRRGERLLEREALQRAAGDPDPAVQAEALRAVRPWSRLGHLYFLEQALAGPTPAVQAESLRNLARIPPGELSPELVGQVQALVGPEEPDPVRLEAMEALAAWRRLEWGAVQAALLSREAGEALRVTALRLSDRFSSTGDREVLLLDLLASDPSPRLAWGAFRRLEEAQTGTPEVARAVARYLTEVRDRNPATEEMAAFLGSSGYRVEHRQGAWKITIR